MGTGGSALADAAAVAAASAAEAGAGEGEGELDLVSGALEGRHRVFGLLDLVCSMLFGK